MSEPVGAVVDGSGEHFGQVERVAAVAGELSYLGSAAEPVGEDRRVLVGGAHRGQQDALGARLTDVMMAALEPEVAREPAAAAVEPFGLHAAGGEQVGVGVPAKDGVLVAVDTPSS